jgi:hypothetical protein
LGAAEPSTSPSPANRRLRVLVGVLGALLAVAVVMIVVLWPQPANTPTATDAPRPVPSSTPAPITPTLTPAPSPTGSVPPGTPRPTDCGELYSPDMVDAFGDLELNPDWLDEPGEELRIGPADDDLRDLIQANESLRCIWTTAEGASDVGVVTAVVWVDATERAEVTERLEDLGYNCYPEREGMRCVTETTTDEGTFGESHFLRDGIWLSTQYSNAGPAGYTLDIVDNLWPDD